MRTSDKKTPTDRKAFWNAIAKIYSPLQQHSNSDMYQQVIELCSKYISKDSRVLELACGTGQLTFSLWQEAAHWEATDYSEQMIRELSKQCPEGLNYSVEDATNLPYENNSFQVVLIANALHIIPDHELALREIHRVLSSGGILLAPTFVFEGHINKKRLKMMELVGFPSCHEWTLDELLNLIEENHFKVVEQSLIECSPVSEAFIAAVKV